MLRCSTSQLLFALLTLALTAGCAHSRSGGDCRCHNGAYAGTGMHTSGGGTHAEATLHALQQAEMPDGASGTHVSPYMLDRGIAPAPPIPPGSSPHHMPAPSAYGGSGTR